MENNQKPKIVHIFAAQSNPLEERDKKILSSFCELEEIPYSSESNFIELIQSYDNTQQIITSQANGELLLNAALSLTKKQLITLYCYDNNLQNNNLAILQESFSTFNFNSTTPGNAVRILYQHFHSKKSEGIYSLMEKGSLILGEKIQSLTLIGTILDQLHEYLSQNNPAILKRSHDIRQLLTAMISEALQKSIDLKLPYPTVDFQFSANAEKACFGIRFPIETAQIEKIRTQIHNSENLPWFLTWKSADILLLKIINNQEIEVRAVITSGNMPQTNSSLLVQHVTSSIPPKDLLSASSGYNFLLINEIKVSRVSSSKNDILEIKSKTDDNETTQDLSEKLKTLTKELTSKKNELLKTVHNYENEIDILKKRSIDAQKKIDFLTGKMEQQQSLVSDNNKTELTVQQLIQNAKNLEKEKQNQIEKLQNEMRKSSTLEKKYIATHKELLMKDKEIIGFKTEILKLKRENQKEEKAASAATQASNNASNTENTTIDKETVAKIKDLEAKEAAFKQEVRKLNFKLDASEKNLRVIKEEYSEKIKLMEKKLEGAKLKEVDLLKKIEDLGSALKKAAKAA